MQDLIEHPGLSGGVAGLDAAKCSRDLGGVGVAGWAGSRAALRLPYTGGAKELGVGTPMTVVATMRPRTSLRADPRLYIRQTQ